eukprot:TRINITY_DN6783_c2_g1_i1.p1 TRINITY_DN6783_c2_g1~~TRINITY_DN6783_c2_g1_i1.p1  ORF type:complete len:380 (+),score=125.36 TRINITY_DN6783_c2_g1_i1:112-1251(+)
MDADATSAGRAIAALLERTVAAERRAAAAERMAETAAGAAASAKATSAAAEKLAIAAQKRATAAEERLAEVTRGEDARVLAAAVGDPALSDPGVESKAEKDQQHHPAGSPCVVAAGFDHAVVLLRGGRNLMEWGEMAEHSVPAARFTSVYAGNRFAVGLSEGRLEVWGDRMAAALNGVRALEAQEVVDCSVYGDWVAAVTRSGQLHLCGAQHQYFIVPDHLKGRVAAVAIGGAHIVVITKDDTIFEMGAMQREFPLGGVVSVSAGGVHYCVVLSDGTAHCFGNNDHKQCNVPEGITDFVSAKCGMNFTVGLRRNGRLVWWGNVPPNKRLELSGPFAAISAGPRYVAAVTTGRRLVADGDEKAGGRLYAPAPLGSNTVAL